MFSISHLQSGPVNCGRSIPTKDKHETDASEAIAIHKAMDDGYFRITVVTKLSLNEQQRSPLSLEEPRIKFD